MADEVLAEEPDLIAVRPLIESVAGGVVGGGAFTGVFRSAVRDVHRALIDRDEDSLTLTLRDIGVVLAGAVPAVRPELADGSGAPTTWPAHARSGPAGADLARAADRVRLLAWLLLAAGGGVRRRCARALALTRRATTAVLGGAIVGGRARARLHRGRPPVALGSVLGRMQRDARRGRVVRVRAGLRAAASGARRVGRRRRGRGRRERCGCSTTRGRCPSASVRRLGHGHERRPAGPVNFPRHGDLYRAARPSTRSARAKAGRSAGARRRAAR